MNKENREKIEAKLFPIYKSFDIDIEKLKDDTSIGYLGLDSLDILEFKMAIEDEFAFKDSLEGELTFSSTHKDILKLIAANTDFLN